MRSIAYFLTKWLAKAVLARYKPVVIGITGSVGKTTTKDAITFMLSESFRVRGTIKNYNNEIGLPLTILGVSREPSRSLLRWIGVIMRALRILIVDSTYPKILVLEMGVDRPGDMAYLLSIARPNVAVETGVASAHIEFFGTREAIAEEKGKLVSALSKDGVAVLNADNRYSWAMREYAPGRVIGYGFGKRAGLRAFNDSIVLEGRLAGMTLKVEHKDHVIPIRLKHVIARHHVEAILAALAVCDALELNFLAMTRRLEMFQSPPGRFRVLEGKKGSVLIDDSYNSSPESTCAAIQAMSSIKHQEMLVILGDMLELGDEEASGHMAVAQEIRKTRVEEALLVGPRMKRVFEDLRKNGMPSDRVWWVPTPMDAAKMAPQLLKSGRIVLVKGSQGMRMEIVSEAILEHEEQAEKLLCRQDPAWKKKEFERQ